jgi:hypothetical protein
MPLQGKQTPKKKACNFVRGVASPILAHGSRNSWDRVGEQTLLPTCNRGDQRRTKPASQARRHAARKAGAHGEQVGAKWLRHQAQTMPSRAPNDPGWRRLKSVRYADDVLLGCSGPRAAAAEMKRRLSVLRRDAWRWERSAEKTLSTPARTRAAHGRGGEVVVLAADHTQDRRGQRGSNGALRLTLPKDVSVARWRPYMRQGKPCTARNGWSMMTAASSSHIRPHPGALAHTLCWQCMPTA